MRKIVYSLCVGLCCLLAALPAQAFHIVGGELTYVCNGNNSYTFYLTVYRDCHSTTEFDTPAYLFVFRPDGTHIKLTLPYNGATTVLPPDDICLNTLPDVCVEQSIYTVTTTLTPIEGGYTVVYQRYSRNNTIVNILSPEETGSSYLTNIPDTDLAICNNTPTFNTTPPIVICANQQLVLDQSATDIDSDSLVYELCNPLVGGWADCPQPGHPDNCNPSSTPADPPPYASVNWGAGYSATSPLDGQMSIDSHTGVLTVFPTITGQYVAAICITEYRNGVAINSIRRDLQFNVTDCEAVQAAIDAPQIDAQGTYLLASCDDYTVNFINTSNGASSYNWILDGAVISTLASPSYTFPDTGQYHIQLIAYSDVQGCTDQCNILVNIYPMLTASFNAGTGCSNTPIAFSSTATTTYGTIESWAWDFGNGQISHVENPSFAFPNGGSFPVTLTVSNSVGCTVSITQSVNVLQSPLAIFEATPYCPNVPVQFTDISQNGPIVAWQWSFDANTTANIPNPAHTYTQTGGYTAAITVTAANGCTDDWSDTFSIYPAFTASASTSPTQICEGATTTLSANDDQTWYSYQWSPAELLDNNTIRTPIASPTATTTFTVTVSDPNGCAETAQTLVTVLPSPEIEVMPNTNLCIGDNITLTASLPNNITSTIWSSDDFSTTDAQPSISPMQTTTYTLSVTDTNGCSTSEATTISVIQQVSVNAGPDAQICIGDSLTLGGQISPPEATFIWLPSIGIATPTSAVTLAIPTTTTTYLLTAQNECFSDADTVIVTVHTLPDVSTNDNATINVGETIQLQGNGSGSGVWTNNQDLTVLTENTPTVQPLQTTTYYYTVTDVNNCSLSDSTTVIVTQFIDLVIPNAFSPNDDNINDLFRILQQRGISNIEQFAVYNRWGQKVYDGTLNNFKGWDGTFKSMPQTVGVYVYYITARDFFDHPLEYKGNLTLIR